MEKMNEKDLKEKIELLVLEFAEHPKHGVVLYKPQWKLLQTLIFDFIKKDIYIKEKNENE